MNDKLHFVITPKGFVVDEKKDENIDVSLIQWKEKIINQPYQSFYDLAFKEKPQWLDNAGNYLYFCAEKFVNGLTKIPDIEISREQTKVDLNDDLLDELLMAVPYCLGAENVNEKWLKRLFSELNKCFSFEIKDFDGSVSLYLSGKSQSLKAAERIFFHLVENKDEQFPFAFLATYATRGENGKIRHLPLQYALTEYKNDRGKLLELLSCLNRAADESNLINELVSTGEMFHPLRLTSKEAWQFLLDVEKIEKAGIVCRIPNWWKKRNANISLSVTIGDERPTLLGLDSLLTMVPRLSVDGTALTMDEIQQLLDQSEGLSLLKGKWVAVDHQKLKELLEQMNSIEGEITLKDALRLQLQDEQKDASADVGRLVTNGTWLSSLMKDLRSPKKIKNVNVPKSLHATLRPYQKIGYTWLNTMDQLGFGACLADDMGLGKTIQVLAYLEKLRKSNKNARVLLVVPASLLGNWIKEAEKFTPEMSVLLLHGKNRAKLGDEVINNKAFLNITTYGMACNIPQLEQINWNTIILDEAQAIKNPLTKQTRQIKKLQGRMKIAMTGTPIENDLSNLWSLFDFLNKGLLGTSSEFSDYAKRLDNNPEGYGKLKSMISPFLLRRVKSDKSIIKDLPDKQEMVSVVELSKRQVVLYRKYIVDLEKRIEDSKGIERKGIILSALLRLKQLCNHPDQYLGQDGYNEQESGKFEMLREICTTIYEKRERVLVFTQFKEIIPHLDDFLATIFERKGLVIHGGTPVATRQKMVEEFQSDHYVPYMILSLRAGGTGLNLTNATHVIHFDRWWNPAVENQATDRAYRIGQRKNVMVYKFVCKGTIEEKIDQLINSKKELAENVVGSTSENWITELSDKELFSLLKLEQ